MYYNWKEKINVDELKKVCSFIKEGEIVVFPTETVYGIGANALDVNAVKKIFYAKGRPSDNPLIVHLSEKNQIGDVAKNITPVERKIIDTFMPGPLTIILEKNEIVPDGVTAGLNTVAVRIPNHIIARKIISSVKVPIAAPSANISGKPSGTNIETIREELEGKVAAMIDGGETEIGLESTVVKVIDEIPIILRPGKITPEDIKKVIGTVKIDDNIFKEIEKNQKVESPGMKYRHYAPDTKCRLIYFEDEINQINKMNELIEKYKRDVVVLGFSEHKEKIMISKEKFIDIGSKENLDEIAKKIYGALRKADKIKPQIILIEGIKRQGLGIAIMNRLLRTCEYNYIEG